MTAVPAADGVLDTLGMFDAAAGLPEQVEAAAAAARGLAGLPDRAYVENVVLLGMGGSGIAGDVLVAVAGPFLPVPVTVAKSYDAPEFVGRGSLVFAVSFSGDTEETVEAAGEAYEAGADLVVVTTGGELGRLAADWGAPTVAVPDSIPQPRAALGAMAVPPLVVLAEMGLFPGADEWLRLAVEQLRRRRDQLIKPGSTAAAIADGIGRTIPLLHGAQAVGAAATTRWRAQINENAKTPAFAAVHPELCHNEIAGWGQMGDITRQVMSLVNLRHDAEHPQVARRFELVEEMLREAVGTVVSVRAEGDGDLAQLLDLVLVGDFVSLHLAVAAGVDPGPVPVLTDLKRRLRSG
ncbi:MAG: bifunctional phosphoglucose/phosphomannose isomerase [Actinomycetota bacterium]|nr:bifunctional phosphoglucose/phosphomannose isomerase [Actinomycetota bacterium]MDA8279843.1 bifunctional phosphoglucose/phosphomannose isomerase [Actinomycetota bacterium]